MATITEQKAKLVSLVWFSAITLMAGAAPDLKVGETLPELKGEFLTGRAAVLPTAASGRVALLLIGFSYDSRFQVEA